MDWIDTVTQDIAELDYSSIEGQPEVMQVTAAELRVILERSQLSSENLALRAEIETQGQMIVALKHRLHALALCVHRALQLKPGACAL